MKNWIILISVLYLSCAGTKKVPEQETPLQGATKYDESFDPLSLNDDDIEISGAESAIINDGQPEDNEKMKTESSLKQINGFRVQILATKNIETASLFEQEANERFQHQEQKIYLVFETPLYKIRIGDCKNRNEAELLRDLAKDYGYREAFIVKSKIQVSE